MPQRDMLIEDLFVDREAQTQIFLNMLDGKVPQRIMLIEGVEGLGKSWLLHTLCEAAFGHDRKPLVARLDFGAPEFLDVFELLGTLRDELGAEHFTELTRLLAGGVVELLRRALAQKDSQPLTPGASSPLFQVGAGAQLGDTAIGNMAGGDIIQTGPININLDTQGQYRLLEESCTQEFFQALKQLTASRPAVLFFDTFERNSLSESTWTPCTISHWMKAKLLARIKRGELPNVIVVIAGRKLPELEVHWNRLLNRVTLEPLMYPDVEKYLRERRSFRKMEDSDIKVLFYSTNGQPQLLGLLADNIEEHLYRGQGDW